MLFFYLINDSRIVDRTVTVVWRLDFCHVPKQQQQNILPDLEENTKKPQTHSDIVVLTNTTRR